MSILQSSICSYFSSDDIDDRSGRLSSVAMATRRSYGDPCGLARALDAVGERWALLVIRELLLGPKRFADLARGLPQMSQNVLSGRLRELEDAGLVGRRVLGPPASTRVYELTERGAALEPAILALAHWGSREPLRATAELSTDALVLALRSTFDPKPASGRDVRCDLRLGDDRFAATIADGRFTITRGTPAGATDVTITTDAPTLRGVVFGGRALSDARAAGDLRVDGDRRAAERFTRCFPRPAPPF
jgi:DNA-binding HxlR family transcriptional regulator